MKVLLVSNLPTTHKKVEKTIVKLSEFTSRTSALPMPEAFAGMILEKDLQVCDLPKQIQINHNALFAGKHAPSTLEDDYVR